MTKGPKSSKIGLLSESKWHSLSLWSFWFFLSLFFFFCIPRDSSNMCGLLRVSKHELCQQDNLLIQENKNVQVEEDCLIFISVHILLERSVRIKSWATEHITCITNWTTVDGSVSLGAGEIGLKGRSGFSRSGLDLRFCIQKFIHLLLCVYGWHMWVSTLWWAYWGQRTSL